MQRLNEAVPAQIEQKQTVNIQTEISLAENSKLVDGHDDNRK